MSKQHSEAVPDVPSYFKGKEMQPRTTPLTQEILRTELVERLQFGPTTTDPHVHSPVDPTSRRPSNLQGFRYTLSTPSFFSRASEIMKIFQLIRCASQRSGPSWNVLCMCTTRVVGGWGEGKRAARHPSEQFRERGMNTRDAEIARLQVFGEVRRCT